MNVAVPKESRPGERRVAATPESVTRLKKLGFDVLVESQAGAGASFNDDDYANAGATIVADARQLWGAGRHRAEGAAAGAAPGARRARSGSAAAGRHASSASSGRARTRRSSSGWPRRKVTAIAIDQVPRITRAQKMDALSSMANIAGYRAVIEAASFYGRFFTGQMTAAGRVPPAKVLVIGAGVAGLAAIGAARGPGRDRARVRHARRGPRAGEEHGRRVPRGDDRGRRRGRRRLRQGDEPRVHRRRDGALRRAGQGRRHHHHHGAHSQRPGADPHHRGDGAEHEDGLGHRRPRRRERRQLRAHAAGIGRRALRRSHHRLHRSAEPPRADRERALRQQPRAPPGRSRRRRQLPHRSRTTRWCAARSSSTTATIVWPPPRREPPPAPAPPKAAAPAPKPPADEDDAESAGGQSVGRDRWRWCSRSPCWRSGFVAPPDVPVAPHRLRARVLRRLAGRLERHAGAAHAAHERHQRHQRHHRRRRHAAGERAADVARA